MNEAKQQDLLAEWYRRIVLSSQGHYNPAQRLGRLNWLPIGFSAFPFVFDRRCRDVCFCEEKEVPGKYWIMLGLAGILAAVLASLQTFLGFAERAERRRMIGAHYAALRRELPLSVDNP